METPFSLPKQGQIGETYIQGTSKTGEAYGQEPPSPQLSQQIPQNILGTDGTLVQEGRTPLQKSLRKYLKQLRNKPGGSRVSFSSSDSSSMTSSNEVSTRTKS